MLTLTPKAIDRDMLAEIGALRAELDRERAERARLNERVERLERLLRARHGVSDADIAVVRAIATTAGNALAFSARELVERMAIDTDLRDTLEDRNLADTYRLGRFLARVQDRPIAGVRINRVGRDCQGAIWTIDLDDDDLSSGRQGK